MIRQIHKGLGIPTDILLGTANTDCVDLAQETQYDYTQFPWKEMLERGYLGVGVNNVQQAKKRGEELIRGFMRDVFSESDRPALLRAPLHQSGSRVMDEYALLVWRIAVLKKARHQKHALKTQYKPGFITDDWLRDLVKLSRFERGPGLAVEYLADIGVVLVIEGHFKKTYLDGAAMLDGETPVVALTLRHDRSDNFWFALTHELIHVQKHLNPERLFIADNLDDKTRSSREETEADTGASEALIPAVEWEASTVKSEPSSENAIALADKLRIHPSIIGGRVRHETGNWRLLNGLNVNVRRFFIDQLTGCEANV
jgi:HTH-type transcriptional regulator/antitoxin HigA